jgi:hypothetical protein
VVLLAEVFAAHERTVLLYDGAAASPEVYKTLVGLALDVQTRFGERVAVFVVTQRNDRPFEIPCEVPILFDDGAAPPGERAEVRDRSGDVIFEGAPAMLNLAKLG